MLTKLWWNRPPSVAELITAFKILLFSSYSGGFFPLCSFFVCVV